MNAPSPQEPGATTRQKILEAARKVFSQKGYDGARMREIATAAGVNLALMNYHFGSKEALFQEIYIKAFAELRSTAFGLLDSDQPMEVKVRLFLEHIMTNLKAQPELPVFVFTELHRSGGAFLQQVPPIQMQPSGLLGQLGSKALAEGKNPTLVAFAFALLSASMGLFPFLLRPMIEQILAQSNASFDDFLQVWQAQATEVLLDRGQKLTQQ